MKRDRKHQLLKVLLGTGLYLLDPVRDRFVDQVSDIGDRARHTYDDAVDRVSDISDSIRGRFHRPSRLKWMLFGMSVGVGAGLLLAPCSGREARESLSDRVHHFGGRVRDRFQSESEQATGTKAI
jgi:hypothetical protein